MNEWVEVLAGQMLLAAVVIVLAVAAITTGRARDSNIERFRHFDFAVDNRRGILSPD